MGFKASSARNGTSDIGNRRDIIRNTADKAFEGAIWYLQEELQTAGIDISDGQALKAVRQASNNANL